MLGVAFVAGFVVFGVLYSFGVLLEPIMRDLGTSRSATSAFYAISSLVFYMLGPVTGRIGDRLGPAKVTAAGAAAMGLGLATTAWIDDIWSGYFTYGVGVGVGAACAYIPTFANIGGWFDRWRTKALGIAAAGTGCGMLIVPPACAMLIQSMGWRQAVIVLGLASGLLLTACALIVRPPPSPRSPPPDRSLREVLQSTVFCQLYVSWVLATMALFVPLVFLPSFAIQNGADPLAAAWLISILGGASIVGRLGIGYVAEAIGTIRLYKLAVLIMGASYGLWLALPAYAWLMLFAGVLGLAYGIRIALVAPVLIEFFGLKDFGAVLGFFFTATGIAGLLGPLLAGLAVDYWGDYQAGIATALILGSLGYLAILPLRPGDR